MQNTKETFIIHQIIRGRPTVYILKDASNNILKGKFYKEELTPVICEDKYSIEVLKTKKIQKKIYYLVKWVDYPSCDPTWIPKEQVEQM